MMRIKPVFFSYAWNTLLLLSVCVWKMRVHAKKHVCVRTNTRMRTPSLERTADRPWSFYSSYTHAHIRATRGCISIAHCTGGDQMIL